MDELIGREKEIRQIQSCMASDKAEFVAVYGRRRVGKTYLITRLLDEKLAFDMTGVIGGTKREQLHFFNDALQRAGYDLSNGIATNWFDAFSSLEKLLEQSPAEQQQIIFIDELPCLDTPNSGFIKAIDHFWNGWASRRSGLKLIVCGSATSWMVSNLIDNKGGLHNRITHEIHLQPFTLHEVELYLKSRQFDWSRFTMVQAYMMMGGIPYYFSLLNRDESLAQSIDRHYFSEGGEMRREFNRLYSSLFNKVGSYTKIINLLAESKMGLTRSEISDKLRISSGGTLTQMLDNLVNCDFVRCYFIKKKNVVSVSGIYQLTDFFTLFHLSFGRKPITEPDYWSKMLNTPTLNTWQGLAFEQVCMAHIPQIKKALGIDRIHTEYYSWRSYGKEDRVQIDLLIDRADGIINLCEIKFATTPYVLGKSEAERLLTRQAVFASETSTRSGICLTLIAPYGLTSNSHSDCIHAIVTLDDLFNE